jgi:hypothetical protein
MLITNRRTVLHLAAVPLLALALVTTAPAPAAYADRSDERGYDDRDRYEDRRRSGYNSEYLFAATRGVTDMDVSPALKVPLIPLTLVLDLVALPFEAVAGLF